ncbi:MAG: DUF4249 family protein [Bacteroidota bacterium]
MIHAMLSSLRAISPASVPRRGRWRLGALAAMVLAGSLAGCDDTFVDPFIRDAGSFSMYGVLLAEGTSAPQRVRVQVVRTLPDPPTEPNEPAARPNVRVTSETLGTDQTRTWDSTHVRLGDGTLGAVFASTFRPTPGETYRIQVLRDADGREATAEVTVPAVPQATVSPAVVSGSDVTQTVAWDSRVLRAEVRYFVFHPSIGRFEAITPAYALPEDGVFTLDLVRDRTFIREALIASGEAETIDIRLSRIQVEILGTQETSWPDLPDLDAEAGQPGAYSNVTGGYGLVVAATRGSLTLRPDREAAIEAGFQPTY